MNEDRFFLSRVNNAPVTTEDILTDLKKAGESFDSVVTMQSYAQHGKYSVSAIALRFGSWAKAVAEAGFEIGNVVNYSDAYMFENILRLWEYYGRQPRRAELALPPSQISQSPYNRRFKGWTAALEAFVDYANAAEIVFDPKQVISRRTSRDPSLRQRFHVLKRDHFKCVACGASPSSSPGLQLHVDHVVPWSLGGETVNENLQTLCERCNLGKSNVL